MKKHILVYVTPARELKVGDRILTGRMTVADVESVEAFEDSTKRPCVAVVAHSGNIVVATNFVADESVLVLG
jgi:hypothetical protein